MSRRSLVESFNCAIEGFMHAVRTQRNMRLHLAAAGVVILALLLFMGDISAAEVLIVIASISLVLITEMLNTAIEVLMDMVNSGHHPKAKVVKDVAAGAVLISALNAVGVAYLLLARHMHVPADRLIRIVATSPWHLTAIALAAIVVACIVTKTYIGRGRPLRGGMPSIHSALGFGAWAATLLLLHGHLPTEKLTLIGALLFIMAVLLAESRVRDKIHTRLEVTLGALLGVVVVLLAFQLAVHFG